MTATTAAATAAETTAGTTTAPAATALPTPPADGGPPATGTAGTREVTGAQARPLRVSGTPRRGGPAGYPEASTRPGPRVRRVRVGAPGVRRAAADEEGVEPRPLRDRAPEPLPDPTSQCCSVVRAAVEVLRGERPAGHLARWVTPQVRDQLAERARIGLAHRAGSAHGPTLPVQVRRVRLVRLGEDVAEATVVLDDDGRVRAAAVRMEARRGTWRVAVLEIG